MSKGRRAAAGLLVLVVGGFALVLLVLGRTSTLVHASPAITVVITDPDSDDQVDAIWKTRQNTNGTLRAKVEAEINEVVAGGQYAIRVTVVDIATGESVEAATPILTAQPPR